MISGAFRGNLNTIREYYVNDELTLEIGIAKKKYYNASDIVIIPDENKEILIKIILNDNSEKKFTINSKTSLLFTEDKDISDIKLFAWQCEYNNIWESVKYCNKYISDPVKVEDYRGQLIIKGQCKVNDKVCRIIRLK
jgi:hypothetical protein